MGKQTKCLIADDHPIVRKGVRELLLQEKLCTTVEEVDTAAAVLSAMVRESWDLLILDISLPDKHGLEVLKEARVLRPSLKVLMLSLYPEREFALRAFKAGASGYLTKERGADQLVTAVKEILSGRRYITSSLADQMASFLELGQPDTPHEVLTDREMQVLRPLGQGKSVSRIADQLALSVKTVSTHRANVLRKLQLATTGALIRYALDHHLSE